MKTKNNLPEIGKTYNCFDDGRIEAKGFDNKVSFRHRK